MQGSGSARTSLGHGVVRPQGARIDWASLLKRVFLEDVLACPCGGQHRIVSDVHERSAVIAIVAHLGLPTEPPPLARARDPAQMAFGFEEVPPRQRARSPGRDGGGAPSAGGGGARGRAWAA